VRHPDQKVAVTVAIDVAGRRGGVAERSARLPARHRPGRGGRKAPRGAVVDPRLTFVSDRAVPSAGGDHNVVVAVAIDVPGGSDDATEARAVLIPHDEPGGASQAVAASVPAPGQPFVDLAGVVAPRAPEEVREAVAVHIGEPDAPAGLAAPLARVEVEPGGGRIGVGGAEVHPDGAAVRPARVGVRRRDDEVGEAVPVDVAGRRQTEAEVGSGLVALQLRVDGRPRAVRRAAVDPDEPFGRFRVVVVGRGDREVGEAVPVRVAGRGHRPADLRGLLVPLVHARGGRFEAGVAPQVDDRAALPHLSVLVARPADDDVPEAVAVDVTGEGERAAEQLVRVDAGCGPVGNAVDAAGAAVQAVDDPLVGRGDEPLVVDRGNQHVGVAVAVDVPGGRDGRAERVPLARAVERDLRVRGEPAGIPVEDVDPSLVLVLVGQRGGADHDVVVTVAVDVPRGRDGEAEVGGGLPAFPHPVRRRIRAVRPPQVEPRASFLVLAVRVVRGSDDDVVIAVTVDVSGGPHAVAERRVGPADHRPARDRGDPVRAAEEDPRAADVDEEELDHVVVRLPHDHIGVAVAVDVPGRADRPAQVGRVLGTVEDPGGTGGNGGRGRDGQGRREEGGGEGRDDDHAATAVEAESGP